MYLTDEEFKKRHREWINSPQWKAFRLKAIEHYKRQCKVCGMAYQKGKGSWLEVDHRKYRDEKGLIFGRETLKDVRVVCSQHHGKGVRSDDSIRMWRNSLIFCKTLAWLFVFLFRILQRIVRRRRSRPS